MKKTIGARISELRRANGLTQEEVAEKMGVSAQAVSKWENDVSCPDIMALPTLAKLLGVTVDDLLSEEGEAVPETKYVPKESRKKFEDMVLRIRIYDNSDNDETSVVVNLPMPLIKLFMESGVSAESIGGNEAFKNIDFAQIIMMVENGMIGKLVEINSSDSHVEIVVE